MRAVADPVKQAEETGFATDLSLHEVIEAECDQQAEDQNNVKLRIDRTTGLVADPSTQNHEKIEQQDCKGRGGMGASQADEHVVQVRLVGMERGLALQDAGRHHTQRIENRNRQHRQCKGHKSQILLGMHHVLGVVLQQPHDEYRHDDAHHERPAVSDEHLRRLAEDIVEEERNERPCGYGRQNSHDRIVGQPEHHPELDTRHDAVARRKPVHTVDQVDGIDDAYGSEHRQRDGDTTGNLSKTPKPVKIIQHVTSDKDQQQDGADLDQKAQCRGEVEDIIERPGIEHDHHGDHYNEQVRTVAGDTGAPQSDHRTEKHGNAAQNGNRLALKFPGIGIIHDVLVEGNGNQSRVNPANAQNRNQRGNEIQHIWGYLLIGIIEGNDCTQTVGPTTAATTARRDGFTDLLPRSNRMPRIEAVSQPTVVIVKTPDELQLTFFRIRLLAPRIDGCVRMIPTDATVRAAIERNQQQRTRLFGADQRQDAANHTYQSVELLLLSKNRIGRKQHRVKFAAHDVTLQLQTAVLLQRLPGQPPIRIRHPLR